MSEVAFRRARLALWALFSIALVAGTALLAHAALFGDFSDYDDEGYMLLSLRSWREGNPLYDDIPTIYGPFYFQSVASLSALLRMPLDNAGGRWIALGVWILSSLLCGAWAWRLHRSFLAALIAWALAFRTLSLLTKEPLHPGHLIVLLLAIAVHVALGLARRPPRLATWAVLGALAGMVGLTKANVGLFLVAAVLATWARFSERARGTRLALAVLLPALPFVLMRGRLDEAWVRDFAVLVAASLLPFGILKPAEKAWGVAPLIAFLAGGAGVVVLSIGALFVDGTTPAGLWRELVVAAVKFPAQTWREPELPPAWIVAAGIALVPVGFVLRARNRAAFAAFRGAAAICVLAGCALRSTPMASLPFLWIFAMSGPDVERRARERPLFFLAIAVCLQSMHAFPVAGSQVAFFAFLLPLVGVAGLADAWSDLRPAWRERAPAWIRKESVALLLLASVLLLTSYYPGWKLVPNRWREYRQREVDLELPGTELMRLPESRAAAYAWAAANVREHADVLLGFPGRHSLHLWSGVPSPVPFYPAAWPLFYGEEEQRKLADALLLHARPCIVRTPYALEAMRKNRGLVDRAIARTIDERFRVAGGAFGLEILLSKEDRSELVLTARPTDVPVGLAAADGSVALRLCFPEMQDVRISRLSLVDVESGGVLCDTAGAGGVPRMLVEGGLEPLVELQKERELVAVCPPGLVGESFRTLLVRASTADGRVVARLPLIR